MWGSLRLTPIMKAYGAPDTFINQTSACAPVVDEVNPFMHFTSDNQSPYLGQLNSSKSLKVNNWTVGKKCSEETRLYFRSQVGSFPKQIMHIIY